MYLFALVLTLCSLKTSNCDNYVPLLYQSSEDCEYAAAQLRRDHIPGVMLIYCTPTTKEPRHARH